MRKWNMWVNVHNVLQLYYIWWRVLVVAYQIYVCTWEKVCGLRNCWALARIHTLGWRATNPCLQWHLNEPWVLIQRAFLQGLDLDPRLAHSSISRGRERDGALNYVCPYIYKWLNMSISGAWPLFQGTICINTRLCSVFASGPVQIQYCTHTSYPDRTAHTVHWHSYTRLSLLLNCLPLNTWE